MSSTDKSKQKGNRAVHRRVPKPWMEAERPGSQVSEPTLNDCADEIVGLWNKPFVDADKIESLARQLLLAIGENPDREGLRETPRRYAKWWKEFVEYDAGNTLTCFESESTDQMVVLSGIEAWSLCEHHLLPFHCQITAAYMAQDHILGLSKIARIITKHCHKLQVQERLVHQIADELERAAQTKNVAVMARGTHTCMVMRGIKKDGLMTTSVLRGLFRHSPDCRREFLSIVLGGKAE